MGQIWISPSSVSLKRTVIYSIHLQGPLVNYNRQRYYCWWLTVVIYEHCWKHNMQSHILKHDVYCATTAVLSASAFLKCALSCLSSLLCFSCSHDISAFIWVRQSKYQYLCRVGYSLILTGYHWTSAGSAGCPVQLLLSSHPNTAIKSVLFSRFHSCCVLATMRGLSCVCL